MSVLLMQSVEVSANAVICGHCCCRVQSLVLMQSARANAKAKISGNAGIGANDDYEGLC